MTTKKRERRPLWTDSEVRNLRAWKKLGLSYEEMAYRLASRGRTARAIEAKLMRVEGKVSKVSVCRADNVYATQPRKCLRCEKTFESYGPQNRMCNTCRGETSNDLHLAGVHA